MSINYKPSNAKDSSQETPEAEAIMEQIVPQKELALLMPSPWTSVLYNCEMRLSVL